MKLSVVILNYNVRYFLEQCVLSVQEAVKGLDAEIIVVDNNSQDGSCEMLKQKFPEVRLFQNQKNLGFSKANNQGVKEAKGEYVCILNPDTVVPEDVFQKTLLFAEETKDLGALGVKLIDGTGNFLPESKRNLPTPKVSLQKLLWKDPRQTKYYAFHIKENETAPVDVLVGAFMLLKKHVFEEVGGFDEDYFMYGEDIDLSFKLIKAGYRNFYFGKTTVLHYKGESTDKDVQYLKRFYGAMRIFYRKHFRSNGLFDAVIIAGTGFAQLARFFKIKNQPREETPAKNHILLSENAALKSVLDKKFQKDFQIVPFSVFSTEEVKNSYIVFDIENVGFAKALSTFSKLKNNGNIFRIKPANCNFIVGSDRSDAKGEVSIL